MRPFDQPRTLGYLPRLYTTLALATLLSSCASFGPYHADTATEPFNSVRGPADGRYKLAFIEFGDQGSPLDNSQRKAALEVIHQAERPFLFVYTHGWQNNANSGDICKFEHFLDTISSFPEATGRKVNVIGVYIAWGGRDLTFPGLNLLTFYSRKAVAAEIASQVSCLATLNELALAARDPSKKLHCCMLIGHSFGGLLLGNTISHSILDAGGAGARNSNPWDMAVAFNSADSSISTRQLLKERNYLYQYDSTRHAYVSKSSGGTVIPENRPFLVFLQSENDLATGAFFPIGTEFYNTIGLRYHWEKVPVPGHPGEKIPESEFYTHTPGNDPYLVNYRVVPLGDASAPSALRATEIWGHGGLWSDNSVAMLAALFRMQFPLTTEGATTPPPIQAPSVPVLTQ